MERRKCYISYKFEDVHYRDKIIEKYGSDIFINKSQSEKIDSDDPDYIMQQIREKYLRDSTVTIFLIGTKSHEEYRDIQDLYLGLDSQIIIRREITASLYSGGNGNTINGLLGIVLPEMYEKVFKGSNICPYCHQAVNYINIDNSTVIKEFAQNYYLIDHENTNCHHYAEEDRYAVLTRYDDFMQDPYKYIEQAYKKRFSPIAKNVRVRKFK